jgi:hypothetical protein
VDGVIGGIPCQPHSSPASASPHDDERDLWSPAGASRPVRRLVLLIENVEGMLTSGGAERVWRDLQRLGFAVRADSSRRRKSARRTAGPGSSSSPVVTDSFGARNRTAVRANPESKHHDGVTLNDAILMWCTPSVAIAMGGQANRGQNRQDELLLAEIWAGHLPEEMQGITLPPATQEMVTALSSRLDPPTSTAGASSSPSGLTLSPPFVEALMGWPTGWTACACSATALSRFKRRMRSALSATRLAAAGAPGAAFLVRMMGADHSAAFVDRRLPRGHGRRSPRRGPAST